LDFITVAYLLRVITHSLSHFIIGIVVMPT